MIIHGLDHVLIEVPAGSEASCRVFYGDFLGLSEVPKPEALRARGGVWFALPDGRQLHLGVTTPFTPSLKGHPALRCADLPTFEHHCQNHQIPYQLDHDGAGPRLFLHDPFGNRLEVLQEERGQPSGKRNCASPGR